VWYDHPMCHTDKFQPMQLSRNQNLRRLVDEHQGTPFSVMELGVWIPILDCHKRTPSHHSQMPQPAYIS
jgi:hypothetical protein